MHWSMRLCTTRTSFAFLNRQFSRREYTKRRVFHSKRIIRSNEQVLLHEVTASDASSDWGDSTRTYWRAYCRRNRDILLNVIISHVITHWKSDRTCYGSHNYRFAGRGQMSPQWLTREQPLRDVAAARGPHVRPIPFLLRRLTRLFVISGRCALRCSR